MIDYIILIDNFYLFRNYYEKINYNTNINCINKMTDEEKENQALINGQRETLATYNAFINIQYESVCLDDNDILDFENLLNCK